MTMRWTRIAFLLAALALLAACASTVQTAPAPATSPAGVQSYPLQEYRIQVGDQLDIKFFFNPELNEQVTVRPDGRISLQLAKEVMAFGLTPAQLTEQLAERYKKEIGDPEIAVIVRSFSSQRVYVDGEVYRAGFVDLVGPMTLKQCIAQAGGVRDTGKLSTIILVRRGSDNRPVASQFNLDRVLDGSDPSQDPPMMPNDIVHVPKSTISNINIWVDQYIRKNIPIGIGFGYDLNN
jgi:protein involved in polysaccharide export with SLBB domain